MSRTFAIGMLGAAAMSAAWVLMRWHDPVCIYTTDFCKDFRPPMVADHLASVMFGVGRVLGAAVFGLILEHGPR